MILKSAETLAQTQIHELALGLDSALREAREIERLTSKVPSLNLADAYRVQDELIRFRSERDEKYIGMKMGFTSQAKREQMGLHDPIYGILMDQMQVKGGVFHLKGTIHPKIEPEIAFFVRDELRGRVTADQALAACSGVCAAMEILDSRFLNFKYFSLPDVVADNCSSSHFVLSDTMHDPRKIDVGNLDMVMEINGQPAQSAKSSAISGHPVQSIVQLCEILDSRGLALPAGSIVLAGAATQAVMLEDGQRVKLTVEKLGTVEIRT